MITLTFSKALLVINATVARTPFSVTQNDSTQNTTNDTNTVANHDNENDNNSWIASSASARTPLSWRRNTRA